MPKSKEIPPKFALIKYVLECASDVGFCMKPHKTVGDSQRKDTFCLARGPFVVYFFKSRGYGPCMRPFVQPSSGSFVEYRIDNFFCGVAMVFCLCGVVVFTRVDPLHHECVCACGGLTLHGFK
jgi:hypothetical protein